jgi:hypothetical protein
LFSRSEYFFEVIPMDSTYPLCTLIKSDGARCGSPALKGMNLCFQHIGGNISALTRARATSGANTKLKFAYPGDREAIQHNLFLVAQALDDGKIDNATANTYNRLFRTCELNLRRWQAARQTPGSPRTGLSPWGGQSNEDKRMLPLPDETPEPAEQQSPDINPDTDQETTDRDSMIPDRYPQPCAGAPSFAQRRAGEQAEAADTPSLTGAEHAATVSEPADLLTPRPFDSGNQKRRSCVPQVLEDTLCNFAG